MMFIEKTCNCHTAERLLKARGRHVFYSFSLQVIYRVQLSSSIVPDFPSSLIVNDSFTFQIRKTATNCSMADTQPLPLPRLNGARALY